MGSGRHGLLIYQQLFIKHFCCMDYFINTVVEFCDQISLETPHQTSERNEIFEHIVKN